MSAGDIEPLRVLLGANAHGRVLRAIHAELGPGAIEEFINAVRRLDQHAWGGRLRAIDAIAADRVSEPQPRDGARKQLDKIIRATVRHVARVAIEARNSYVREQIEQTGAASGVSWRTLLGPVMLSVLGTSGAVEILREVRELEQTNRARGARNSARARRGKSAQRRQRIVAARAAGKAPKQIAADEGVTPAWVRKILSRHSRGRKRA